MYSMKDEIEKMFLNSPDKIRAKRKLNEIYDRFGENRLDIENKTTNAEYFEYIMASAYEKEVLEERRKARIALNQLKKDDEAEKVKNVPDDTKGDVLQEVEEEEELSATEQVKKVTEDKIKSMRKNMEDKHQQKIENDLLDSAQSLKNKKEQAINELKDKYYPMTIESMKRQVNRLMDTYGEDLNISYMSHKDADIYMSVKDMINEVRYERSFDKNVKKNRSLEYNLRDNFTPLKATLKKDIGFRKMLETSENIVNYPYLDTKGLHTAGIGYLMKDKDVFIRQPWLYENDDGTLQEATIDQKLEGYNQLLDEAQKLKRAYQEEREKNPNKPDKGAFNYKHTYYKDKTHLRLSTDFIEQEYQRQVVEALKRVKTSFDRYNEEHQERKIRYEKLPSDVLIALAELSYNIGHFNVRFKKMLDAIAVEDYDAAATYSERENPTQSATVKERIRYLAEVLRGHSKK